MTKLTKEMRAALDDDMFAVPKKRKLLINDERHTRIAWDNVEAMKDVTSEERIEARKRILKRASELGLDTKEWGKLSALSLECMSLNVGNSDHPNKMPFTGILTKLDEPSDAPPGGSAGRLIVVTSEAARKALPSLLGMAVNFTPSFDGHDTRAKIGIITSADIVGNELRISGFVYAADFPDVAGLIQDLKHALGFSFEAQQIVVEDYLADVLRITELTFTGAAILRKDEAAYRSTSLAAKKAAEGLDMTPEELKALMGPILTEALKPINDRLTTVETANQTVVASITAANEMRAKVEPLAVALETQATAFEAAGIDAKHLRQQAEHLRAEAAAGRMPKSLTAPPAAKTEDTSVADQIKAAVEAAVKPLNDKLAAQETTMADLKAGKRTDSQEAGRKTLPPQVNQLMSRAGINMPEGDKKLNVGEVDKLLAGANLNLTQRIMVKTQLERAGVLAA